MQRPRRRHRSHENDAKQPSIQQEVLNSTQEIALKLKNISDNAIRQSCKLGISRSLAFTASLLALLEDGYKDSTSTYEHLKSAQIVFMWFSLAIDFYLAYSSVGKLQEKRREVYDEVLKNHPFLDVEINDRWKGSCGDYIAQLTGVVLGVISASLGMGFSFKGVEPAGRIIRGMTTIISSIFGIADAIIDREKNEIDKEIRIQKIEETLCPAPGRGVETL